RVRPTKIHRFGDIVNPSHPPQARLVSASPLSNKRIMPGDVNHRSALFTPADANAATRESFCPTAQVIQAAVTARLPRNNTAPRMCNRRCQLYGNKAGKRRWTGESRREAADLFQPIPSYPLLSVMASVVHKERGPPGGVVARSRNATGHFPTSQ